jgi:NADPH:quinone reductase-like Zn-dependent oxidoreductase
LYYLRKADLKEGRRILIYGASGSVGSYAVQLAKCFGANVTAACSASNMEWVKALGAGLFEKGQIKTVIDGNDCVYFHRGEQWCGQLWAQEGGLLIRHMGQECIS